MQKERYFLWLPYSSVELKFLNLIWSSTLGMSIIESFIARGILCLHEWELTLFPSSANSVSRSFPHNTVLCMKESKILFFYFPSLFTINIYNFLHSFDFVHNM